MGATVYQSHVHLAILATISPFSAYLNLSKASVALNLTILRFYKFETKNLLVSLEGYSLLQYDLITKVKAICEKTCHFVVRA